MQVSDVSVTSGLPYGLGAVTAGMTGHKRMFWDAKYTDFLHLRIAVLVPIRLRRPAVYHIPHRTHKAGTYSRQSCCRLQLWGHTCSIFPATQAVPLGGRYTQENAAAQPVVTGWIFEGSDTFFQRCIEAVLKGPCSFVPQV